MGRLERKLDLELIARMKAGIKYAPKVIKKVSVPREAASYRAAKRNKALREEKRMWKGVKPTARYHHPPVRLNRSKKWDGKPRISNYTE